MYALSNDMKMAVVAYKMAAAAILDFEQNAVTFEPIINKFELGVHNRCRTIVFGPKIDDRPETRWRLAPSWILNKML